MRHGKSSWDNPGLSDIERPLKSRGIKEAALVSKKLSKLKAVPDLIMTSPATRARDTAIIVAQHLGVDLQKLQIEPSIYGAGVQDVLRVLSYVSSDPETIMVFGHNPTFTQVVNHFQAEFLDNLPTCGCYGFEMDIESWDQLLEAKASTWFNIIPSKLR